MVYLVVFLGIERFRRRKKCNAIMFPKYFLEMNSCFVTVFVWECDYAVWLKNYNNIIIIGLMYEGAELILKYEGVKL